MIPTLNSKSESKKVVLLVDDDASFRFAMATELRAAGYLVQCAENGERAIRMVVDSSSVGLGINLIITDVVMPRKNGIRFCQELRQIDPSMSVLVISGNFSSDVQGSLNEFGCRDFLEKPFTPTELLRNVERLLLKEGEKRSEKEIRRQGNTNKNQHNVDNRTNGKETA